VRGLIEEINRTIHSPYFWAGFRRGVIDALALIGFGVLILLTYLCLNVIL
jgi:hypothetical protein